jgi:DNA gyrase/topoisomerase IV subunit A
MEQILNAPIRRAMVSNTLEQGSESTGFTEFRKEFSDFEYSLSGNRRFNKSVGTESSMIEKKFDGERRTPHLAGLLSAKD